MKHRIESLTWVQIFWIFAELIFIECGVLSLCFTNEKIMDSIEFFGMAMMLCGSINIFVYKHNKNTIYGAQWLLVDGMSTVLLSVFPLFNQMIQPSMILFFFGVWELFSGIIKVIDAAELKEYGVKGWKWFARIGSMEILSGVVALIRPINNLIGMKIIVSIIFFVQSCGFLFKVFIYPQITIKK